ncbi:MAG: hypothetical protein EXR69_07815 [Myxococcales bacterium]|nr:hypothetical protein [Myxococcales bacterium]
MSMILMGLLHGAIATAWAAKVYWVGAPTDADRAAVARTLEGATSAPFSEIVPAMAGFDAMATVGSELIACQTLFDVFDGELQAMARLRKAVSDVKVLRSEADRHLLLRALMLEGYAVTRYFQDKVGTDKAAEPYRTGSGPDALITAWERAASLYNAPSPTAADLPDAPTRIAWDAHQAAVRARPSSTFVVGNIASGGSVYIDGQKVDAVPGARILVSAGHHHAHVQVGDSVLWAFADEVAANTTVAVDAPFGPAERDALVAQLRATKDGWTVPAAAVSMAKGEATYLAVSGEKRLRLIRIDGGTATDTPLVAGEATGGGLLIRVAGGAGWVSTGDFFLQNVEAGAGYETSTVNAVAPAVAVGMAWRRGLIEIGGGVDAQISVGEWHSLPTGKATTRTFVYPHLTAGLKYVQLTVGPQFPWYVGFGGQATIPLTGPLELYGRAVYGVPVTLSRGGSEPEFTPTAAISAWGGLSVRFGG